MERVYVVTGTVENDQLIHLDKPLPITSKRVSVIVKPAESAKDCNGETLFAWLEQVHIRRNEMGVKSLTKQEIDDWIRQERESWGD
jgi:hypothetical protein